MRVKEEGYTCHKMMKAYKGVFTSFQLHPCLRQCGRKLFFHDDYHFVLNLCISCVNDANFKSNSLDTSNVLELKMEKSLLRNFGNRFLLLFFFWKIQSACGLARCPHNKLHQGVWATKFSGLSFFPFRGSEVLFLLNSRHLCRHRKEISFL